MNLSFSKEALDFCVEKSYAMLTMDLLVAGSCGGGGVQEPVINPGSPGKPEKYASTVVDGITVFYPVFLEKNKDDLTVVVERYLMMRHLAVKGMETEL